MRVPSALDSNANSFLAVKLNLAKPPRFNHVVHNYIEAAKQRTGDQITVNGTPPSTPGG